MPAVVYPFATAGIFTGSDMIKFHETLYYYDEPLLCTLKDDVTGQLYLALALSEEIEKATVYNVIRVTQFDIDTLGDPLSPHKAYQGLCPKRLRAVFLRENEREWFKCHLCDEDIELIPQTVPMTEDQIPGK